MYVHVNVYGWNEKCGIEFVESVKRYKYVYIKTCININFIYNKITVTIFWYYAVWIQIKNIAVLIIQLVLLLLLCKYWLVW